MVSLNDNIWNIIVKTSEFVRLTWLPVDPGGRIPRSAAHNIKISFPYEQQDTREFSNSQRSISLTPFSTQCHQGEWGERRKSLNWWKMDSGEVLCSGSSHRINGATLHSLFHSPKWSIIPPRLACLVINGADTALICWSSYIFFSFCQGINVRPFICDMRYDLRFTLWKRDWCVNWTVQLFLKGSPSICRVPQDRYCSEIPQHKCWSHLIHAKYFFKSFASYF